jgi:hypothetical protein
MRIAATGIAHCAGAAYAEASPVIARPSPANRCSGVGRAPQAICVTSSARKPNANDRITAAAMRTAIALPSIPWFMIGPTAPRQRLRRLRARRRAYGAATSNRSGPALSAGSNGIICTART